MYLKKIEIKNFGPIQDLVVEPAFKSDGTPMPLLLIGKNGSGKTLFLGNILDSFIECKKKVYNQMPEIGNGKLLKIGTTTYISPRKDYLYTHIVYEGLKTFTYTDFATKLPVENLRVVYPDLSLSGINIDKPQEISDGYYRKITPVDRNGISNELKSNVLIFFPHCRYDHPEWLNNEVEIGFQIKDNYIGQSQENVIKNNVIQDVITWLLDCFLDKYLYESDTEQRVVNVGDKKETWTVQKDFKGRNTTIIKLFNQLLTSIYKLKYPHLVYARTGISKKNKRQISIIIKEIGKDEVEISPSFKHLSSGEVMLLSLFGAIIKEYDRLGINYDNLSDLQGIVVIDEIDLHLHIEHQKILLPQLVSMFPKIQFVITTHSPFFLLGMEELFKGNYKLINMPNGDEIGINDFSEIKDAYNTFTQGFENLSKLFGVLKLRLESITRPLIITEGKTDWKHLKSALLRLQQDGKFTDIGDFDFLEYENEIEMGSTQLKAYCLQRSKLPNEKKIICIFDRDEKELIKDMTDDTNVNLFKSHGNNVYSFCIPIPTHRLNHKFITIEHYYSDDELKTKDENGRRIYLSSEFTKTGRHLIDKNLRHGNYTKIKAYIENDKSKIVEYDVFDENETNIALPKADFAQYILDRKADFGNFDISQFEHIFTVIGSILNI